MVAPVRGVVVTLLVEAAAAGMAAAAAAVWAATAGAAAAVAAAGTPLITAVPGSALQRHTGATGHPAIMVGTVPGRMEAKAHTVRKSNPTKS